MNLKKTLTSLLALIIMFSISASVFADGSDVRPTVLGSLILERTPYNTFQVIIVYFFRISVIKIGITGPTPELADSNLLSTTTRTKYKI